MHNTDIQVHGQLTWQQVERLNMCGEMLVGGSVCGGMEKEALEFRGME